MTLNAIVRVTEGELILVSNRLPYRTMAVDHGFKDRVLYLAARADPGSCPGSSVIVDAVCIREGASKQERRAPGDDSSHLLSFLCGCTMAELQVGYDSRITVHSALMPLALVCALAADVLL